MHDATLMKKGQTGGELLRKRETGRSHAASDFTQPLF